MVLDLKTPAGQPGGVLEVALCLEPVSLFAGLGQPCPLQPTVLPPTTATQANPRGTKESSDDDGEFSCKNFEVQVGKQFDIHFCVCVLVFLFVCVFSILAEYQLECRVCVP